MSKRGQPKVSEFVEISISYKVIQYCNKFNESPFKAWKRLIKHRAFKDLMSEHFKKNRTHYGVESVNQYSQSYGGQFHFDIVGLEDKKILAMDGFGGQQLIIDFDKEMIISVASTDRHYDWIEIVYKTLNQK